MASLNHMAVGQGGLSLESEGLLYQKGNLCKNQNQQPLKCLYCISSRKQPWTRAAGKVVYPTIVDSSSSTVDEGTSFSSAASSPSSSRSSEEKVYDIVLKQAAVMAKRAMQTSTPATDFAWGFDGRQSDEILKEAYARCGEVCAEYAKTFYLGTMLMTLERKF